MAFRNNGPVRPELVKRKFGRLTVEHCFYKSANDKKRPNNRMAYAHCRCECGNEKDIRVATILNGTSLSCGCLQKESVTRHGMSYSKVYAVWGSMIERCRNPSHQAWEHYGGRGITVCDRWMSFENFYSDMGNPSEGMSLERKDNNLGYSSDNCEWATNITQGNNRRTSVYVTYDNETLTVTQLARKYGLDTELLRKRLKAGWDIQEALTKPSKRSPKS